MQRLSVLVDVCAQSLSKLTLYDLLRLSDDFNDVKEVLNGRMNWTIELLRSCFTIRFISGGYLFTMCSLSFLCMAEVMYMYYGRLSPSELKECVDAIGHVQFAMLFAVLDAGVIIVRVAGIFALSETPTAAVGLAFLTVLPSIIPLLVFCIRTLFNAARGRAHRRRADTDAESGAHESIGA